MVMILKKLSRNYQRFGAISNVRLTLVCSQFKHVYQKPIYPLYIYNLCKIIGPCSFFMHINTMIEVDEKKIKISFMWMLFGCNFHPNWQNFSSLQKYSNGELPQLNFVVTSKSWVFCKHLVIDSVFNLNAFSIFWTHYKTTSWCSVYIIHFFYNFKIIYINFHQHIHIHIFYKNIYFHIFMSYNTY